MNARSPGPGLWDTRQAAEYLSVHPNTLYRLVKEEALPVILLKPGNARRGWRFLQADVDQWVKSKRQKGE